MKNPGERTGAYIWAKKLHKQRVSNKKNPWPYINDTDKDGAPDSVDCKPRDPKKQGFREFAGKVKQGYQKWRAEAPQRQAEATRQRTESEERRVESLRRQATMESERAKIEKARAEQRIARERGRPKPMNMGGYSPGMGLMGSGMFEERPPIMRRKSKRKK